MNTSIEEAVISLDDKYRLDCPTVLINGRQALVRLPLAQRELDRRHGLKTAGLISGYRGSPLGSYDLELWRAGALLQQNDILFQPGLNEDLALSALSGSQLLDLIPGRRVDGVFALWYGKGPGVDRSGDAIKHANLQGVAPKGGVLLVFGDDHAGKSSTTAHQSDLTLGSWEVPVLYPGSVAEILHLGLAGIAMSRYSGLVVSLKLVNETADGTAVIQTSELPQFALPDLPLPEGGVHARRESLAMQQRDLRLIRHKLPRAQAFARANRLDRIAFGSESARLVIATAGKAFPDVLAALCLLGISEGIAREVGIGVYKIGLIFPLDPVSLRAVTQRAEEILFVEEKRPHTESQAAAALYNQPGRPRISGKSTPEGDFLLPSDSALDAVLVARAIAERIQAAFPDIAARIPGLTAAADRLYARSDNTTRGGASIARRPAFCSGCPHNISTTVPINSVAGTGIGCHTMVLFQPERPSLPVGHMGAEGAQWIGLAPFTATRHIFQNLGDGTYSHSGSLAIRAAVQAGVNITYKILLNDAVAMTGGQPVEGHLNAARVVAQVSAEGVRRVVVVSEHPEQYRHQPLPTGTELRHRDELARVQEDLRKESGVTVIIYEQTCAAEKRRRRKNETYPDPDQRAFINPLVCEGCGDCSVQSNCISIQPLETELGRKRKIDQSACNKDFSCVKGFCPSFVTVTGAKRRRAPTDSAVGDSAIIPEPRLPDLGNGFDLVIAGIGGTGVVTVSAILGMAGRLEGFGASLYDMTGLSQKAGQVFSHVRLRRDPNVIVAAQVGPAEAHVILACDLIAAVQKEVLSTIVPNRTQVFGSSEVPATADFNSHPDSSIPQMQLTLTLETLAQAPPRLIAANTLSEQLLGDSIGANLILLGFAWQCGAIPLKRRSIEEAIRLNGKAVTANLKAFAAGRAASLQNISQSPAPDTLTDFVAKRALDLTDYWNVAYSKRYLDLMHSVQRCTSRLEGGDAFAWAVARGAYQLMAYKDEYEVARLYTDGRFQSALSKDFESYDSVRFHLAPPLLAMTDKRTGHPRKIAFGSWIVPVFRVLSRLRRLREGPFDIFGRSAERRLERELRDTYLDVVARLTNTLSAETLPRAMEVAQSPAGVRGYGHIKQPRANALLDRLHTLSAELAGARR
jgi:indolepyruvate ferredoxin oxidoreductase